MRTSTALIALLFGCAALLPASRALAQARPAPPPDPVKARKSLTRTLERHKTLLEGLIRRLNERIAAIERRGPLRDTDEGVNAHDRSVRRTEANLARREATLGAVAGAPNERTAQLSGVVAGLRETVAERLKRLVELVPDLDGGIVPYWESPPPPGPATATVVVTPADFQGWVTLEQPDSLEELLGTVAGMDERYLNQTR